MFVLNSADRFESTVDAFLVICMIVTPGATAWLLTDRFPRLLMVSVPMGALTSFVGAYSSYFIDGATGRFRCKPFSFFLLAFVLALRHGLLASRKRACTELRKNG